MVMAGRRVRWPTSGVRSREPNRRQARASILAVILADFVGPCSVRAFHLLAARGGWNRLGDQAIGLVDLLPMDDASAGFILGMPVVVVLVAWIAMALIAAWIAPFDRRMVFFLLTAFILGPFGVMAAAIAQPRPDDGLPASGRTRFICPQCRARSDIKDSATSFECWRCHTDWPTNKPTAPAKPAA